MKFDIIKNGNKNKQNKENEIVGNIVRRVPDYPRKIYSDADNYEVNFPSEATAEEKLLILGSTLLIDYKYFESGAIVKRKKTNI